MVIFIRFTLSKCGVAAELKWLIQAYFFTVMALAPDTNDSDGQFVRKIKLRDTSFLSKRQFFIYRKLASKYMYNLFF
jgi:hypothetical protein